MADIVNAGVTANLKDKHGLSLESPLFGDPYLPIPQGREEEVKQALQEIASDPKNAGYYKLADFSVEDGKLKIGDSLLAASSLIEKNEHMLAALQDRPTPDGFVKEHGPALPGPRAAEAAEPAASHTPYDDLTTAQKIVTPITALKLVMEKNAEKFDTEGRFLSREESEQHVWKMVNSPEEARRDHFNSLRSEAGDVLRNDTLRNEMAAAGAKLDAEGRLDLSDADTRAALRHALEVRGGGLEKIVNHRESQGESLGEGDNDYLNRKINKAALEDLAYIEKHPEAAKEFKMPKAPGQHTASASDQHPEAGKAGFSLEEKDRMETIVSQLSKNDLHQHLETAQVFSGESDGTLKKGADGMLITHNRESAEAALVSALEKLPEDKREALLKVIERDANQNELERQAFTRDAGQSQGSQPTDQPREAAPAGSEDMSGASFSPPATPGFVPGGQTSPFAELLGKLSSDALKAVNQAVEDIRQAVTHDGQFKYGGENHTPANTAATEVPAARNVGGRD